MRVIGTAGHVDHGKSTLIHALTGVHPDRLKEEQERQMTIDLGFAWMSLPDGESMGIVDVPGHRDFIENMLAGIGGVDAALLVIAADEGPMPQTREHLAILDLLEIEKAVVALTKIDLAQDEAWLDLVKEDITGLLGKTRLAASPIVAVSPITGQGLDDLIQALAEMLRESSARPDLGKPRLPIDRVFTLSGFGTVVTGTLVDGGFEVGQQIEILPGALNARIRGLQTHRSKIDRAVPGSRVAANLSGIDVHQLERGDVMTLPGAFSSTTLIDVQVRLLKEAGLALRNNQEVKFFIGSAHRMATARLLGTEMLHPGEAGWLQLKLQKPIVAARGDHFILRRPSPSATLGGGRVADPHPSRHHRRAHPTVVERLGHLLEGTPGEILVQTLIGSGPATLAEATERAGIEASQVEALVAELVAKGELVVLTKNDADNSGETWVAAARSWQGIRQAVEQHLDRYHSDYPSRLGMPREELKSRMNLSSGAFAASTSKLLADEVLSTEGTRVRRPDFSPRLAPEQKAKADALLQRFAASPSTPPSFKEAAADVGGEALNFLLEQGRLIKVSEDVLLETRVYEDMVSKIRQALERNGTIKVAEVRDMFRTSRKYALALMEHLDMLGVTSREGDVRRLVRPSR